MGWWRSYAGDGRFSSSTLTVLIGTFVVLWLLWAIKKQRKAAVPPLPPGPRGLPIVGYLPFVGTELHTKFHQLCGIYGPIYKVWLGNKLSIVISSPSLVKEVVRDQDAIFSNHDTNIVGRIVTYGGADIALSMNCPNWKMLRKIFVREMSSPANLDSTWALRVEEVRNTIRNVYDKKGTHIDLGDLAFITVMNAIMNMLWGGTLRGEEGAKFRAEFKHIFTELLIILGKPNVSDLFPALAKFDLQGIGRKAKKISEDIDGVVDYAIDKQIKSLAKAKEEGTTKTKQKDFLQVLLELKEQDDGAPSMSMTQLKAVVFDIVVAGSDTTTAMSEWVMARLLKHPEIMRKVTEELTEIVGLDNLVEECHLPKLHYLEVVIKETFRLHPPSPFLLLRTPSESSIIGGYLVPKGSSIFLHIWAIQRDPKYWDNPLEFKPERFLNDAYGRIDYSGNNFKYLPFGSGRRICAGLALGERTLKYILASLLHSYEWKLPQGSEIEFSDTYGVITKKKNPTIAIPTQGYPSLSSTHNSTM
ncbi:flavonoid 3'-monooxygenase CYP75B137-like [Juglans microcarpa x Juglans regia]|uniref:flavonoid 3'-monooxygenase CYP75B137-like n=1 Tax=Juglans microcarpa x Juglans regia TaxID=2249226 RepID=UPI001B7F2C08|nr:flavonoid 3'-monooxygenase CYP75B137-like [Juglans microcarpa x Juglans regia]XP_040987310.1 flavonoid 3'-monooxygenase CYP75B137-like [Juglans microcarpa x Juglans regia]